MNELLKLLSKINDKAFEKAKRLEYALGAYIYNKKVDAIIEKYSVYDKVGKFKVIKKDMESKINLKEVPVINYEDYPTEASLNNYLRTNFKDTYPAHIEIHHEADDVIIVFDLEAITEDYLSKDFYLSVSNSKGVFYTYSQHILRTIPR